MVDSPDDTKCASVSVYTNRLQMITMRSLDADSDGRLCCDLKRRLTNEVDQVLFIIIDLNSVAAPLQTVIKLL